MTSGAGTLTGRRLDPYTALALFVGLVAYPVIYCSGLMGRIVRPIFTEDSRPHWWYFWLVNLAFHWIPFALVWVALARNREHWDSIGVDWKWFVRHRTWLGGLIVFLIVMAFLMPGVLYDGGLPKRSRTVFMAPVSTPERLFLIFGAVTDHRHRLPVHPRHAAECRGPDRLHGCGPGLRCSVHPDESQATGSPDLHPFPHRRRHGAGSVSRRAAPHGTAAAEARTRRARLRPATARGSRVSARRRADQPGGDRDP